MPKELARVTALYKKIEAQDVPAQLSRLHKDDNNMIILGDSYLLSLEQLLEALRDQGVTSANDPKVKKNSYVQGLVKQCDKFEGLRQGLLDHYAAQASAQLAPIRKEVATLLTDVKAVIQDKSGYFFKSKSLPMLKALETKLQQFSDDIAAASAPVVPRSMR
jgi:hypothetical protein